MRVIIILSMILFFTGCSGKHIVKNKEKRVALIIGNQHYPDRALKNSIHDAQAIAKRLKKINFKAENIILKIDINYQEFYKSLDEFKNKIDKNTITFFYFSGHANTLHQNSTNSFLAMVENDKNVLVSIHKVYEVLSEAKAKHNIICIDACRDFNISSSENIEKGIVYRDSNWGEEEALPTVIKDNNHYNTPISTIVSFASNINEGARDEGLIDKTHSPYARYLIKHLNDKDDIPVSEMFNRIRVDMRKELHDKQRNSEIDMLEGNPWLNPKKAETPATVAF